MNNNIFMKRNYKTLSDTSSINFNSINPSTTSDESLSRTSTFVDDGANHVLSDTSYTSNLSNKAYKNNLHNQSHMNDLSNKLHINNQLHMTGGSHNPTYMYGGLSNNHLLDNNTLFSETSPFTNYDNDIALSNTSEMSGGTMKYNIDDLFSGKITVNNSGTQNNDFKNIGNLIKWQDLTLYFTQPDTELAWIDNIQKSNSILFGDLPEFIRKTNINNLIPNSADLSTALDRPNFKPLPVVCNIEKASQVADKICKYALYINDPVKRQSLKTDFNVEKRITDGIESSVESDKYAFPIFGSIIFTIKFKSEPKILYLGTIDKNSYNLVIQDKSYDVVIYNVPNEKDCRAIIFNLNLIHVTEVHLRKSDCALGGVKGLAMLKILSTSSTDIRFSNKYANMLVDLYDNGHVKLE